MPLKRICASALRISTPNSTINHPSLGVAGAGHEILLETPEESYCQVIRIDKQSDIYWQPTRWDYFYSAEVGSNYIYC